MRLGKGNRFTHAKDRIILRFWLCVFILQCYNVNSHPSRAWIHSELNGRPVFSQYANFSEAARVRNITEQRYPGCQSPKDALGPPLQMRSCNVPLCASWSPVNESVAESALDGSGGDSDEDWLRVCFPFPDVEAFAIVIYETWHVGFVSEVIVESNTNISVFSKARNDFDDTYCPGRSALFIRFPQPMTVTCATVYVDHKAAGVDAVALFSPVYECGDACSEHGVCALNDTCICEDNWSGANCSTQSFGVSNSIMLEQNEPVFNELSCDGTTLENQIMYHLAPGPNEEQNRIEVTLALNDSVPQLWGSLLLCLGEGDIDHLNVDPLVALKCQDIQPGDFFDASCEQDLVRVFMAEFEVNKTTTLSIRPLIFLRTTGGCPTDLTYRIHAVRVGALDFLPFELAQLTLAAILCFFAPKAFTWLSDKSAQFVVSFLREAPHFGERFLSCAALVLRVSLRRFGGMVELVRALGGGGSGRHERLSQTDDDDDDEGEEMVGGSSAADDDAPVCRICHGSERPFIAPCQCRGTMAFVHAECLEMWRRHAQDPQVVSACQQCGFRYNTVPARGSRAWWDRFCQDWGRILRTCSRVLLSFLFVYAVVLPLYFLLPLTQSYALRRVFCLTITAPTFDVSLNTFGQAMNIFYLVVLPLTLVGLSRRYMRSHFFQLFAFGTFVLGLPRAIVWTYFLKFVWWSSGAMGVWLPGIGPDLGLLATWLLVPLAALIRHCSVVIRAANEASLQVVDAGLQPPPEP